MRLRRRDGDGGGGPDFAAVLGTVGLGAFARLVLPDHPPEELGLAATYDGVSGRILVSLPGAAISASPADLAYALNLPPGPVGLAEGLDGTVFSDAEAIAAVSGFVRDRLIMGDGGDGGPASGEVAAALQLVEEGKAYEVDWGGLVWALVTGEVVAGTPRRYAPYLLHLMEHQRPELSAELDGRFPLRKRRRGQELQQCQWDDVGFLALDDEEDVSLVYGGSQNIGDLEDMPIFGEGKNVAFVGGGEIHAQSQRVADLGPQDFFYSDVKLLGHKMECDDRTGGCSRNSAKQDDLTPQGVSMIQYQPENDSNANAYVGLDNSSYLPQLQEVGGICNYRTLSPFQACMQQIQGYVPAMKSAYMDVEKACRDTRDEAESIKRMVMEKNHLIAATVSDIQDEFRVRSARMRQFEANMDLMQHTGQQYHKLLEKSLAEFQEHRNRIMRGEGVDSCSVVLGVSGGQNGAWVQQAHNFLRQKICKIDQTWSLNCSKLLTKTAEVETCMVKLNHEVQRLNDSRSIPDLNNGVEDNGEGEASMSKTEERSWASEGCPVSNTTQAGKQLVELVANPDQRNDTRESMDLHGVQR
ncbi:uncharacterized protein LOC120676956 [Panicum virgatum]|uniref:Uncharacterized protein n=1 Tax=Panicum virgatum TaxID=38727 RepID=A0A8T0S1H0_PANVG|nr:uncharacterized protein LOC120676956 [Panicum virgatum]KAG2591740.1 hypothetical protein PVAP13_5NG502100 [Panicum virgatum]